MMKRVITICILMSLGMTSFFNNANAASDMLIYGCTSDGLAARINVVADHRDKPTIEGAFRRLLKGHTAQSFLSLKQRKNEEAGRKALADLSRLSGGKLPEQNAVAVARSIAVNKLSHAVRQYCGR